MKRIIWSYWDGPKNNFVERALASWKKYLPDWDVRLLNRETVKKYKIKMPKNYDSLIKAKQSDVIRLSLLYEHGGLWMDATIVLNDNLDWLLGKMGNSAYFGYTHAKTGYIENWLILVRSSHDQSIRKWRDTFLKVLEEPQKIDFSQKSCDKIWGQPFAPTVDYFDCYKTYCYLVQTDPDFRRVHDSIPFIVIKNILKEPYYNAFISNQGKIVKFTSVHRKIYPYIRFPLVYCYVTMIMLIIFLIVLMCRYRG